jgi:hypothetical protein
MLNALGRSFENQVRYAWGKPRQGVDFEDIGFPIVAFIQAEVDSGYVQSARDSENSSSQPVKLVHHIVVKVSGAYIIQLIGEINLQAVAVDNI